VRAAGCGERNRDERDDVAHAAAAVLIDDDSGGRIECNRRAAGHHRNRKRERLVERHAAPNARHAERGHLRFIDASVHEGRDDAIPVLCSQLAAVALALDASAHLLSIHRGVGFAPSLAKPAA